MSENRQQFDLISSVAATLPWRMTFSKATTLRHMGLGIFRADAEPELAGPASHGILKATMKSL